MDDQWEERDLRFSLILAGIKELNAHGAADFSLRRVANNCGASCAAPYRHFKNKNDLILEIIRYINSRWVLLEQQIEALYAEDLPRLITELAMAQIRFQLANPEFRAVLMADRRGLDEEQQALLNRMTAPLSGYVRRCFAADGEETVLKKEYQLQSLIYGAVLYCENGTFAPDGNLQTVRECVEEIMEEPR